MNSQGDRGYAEIPDDGLYPVITSGVVPIGVPVPPAPFLKPANGVDTIRRVAPTVAAYRPRPDEIFAHGYDVL